MKRICNILADVGYKRKTSQPLNPKHDLCTHANVFQNVQYISYMLYPRAIVQLSVTLYTVQKWIHQVKNTICYLILLTLNYTTCMNQSIFYGS